ncbi:hypothetical protein [uncultured Sphaerochaeta sp.]|uniref:hypothetical protein n=1 Tax=uncultured Sphaerochaeta sp. TaxID=886478 RepID=UPI003747B1EE
MNSFGRKTVCIVLLLSLSMIQIMASENNVSLRIKPVAESILAFRYQVGPNSEGKWTEVDISDSVLVLKGFDSSEDILYIQQTKDRITWSDSYEYRYDTTAKTWNISLPPVKKVKVLDSLDVALYGLVPYGTSSTLYSYVLGTQLKVSFSIAGLDNVIGYGAFTYSLGPSKSDWVDSLQAVGATIGIGYKIQLGNGFEAIPGIGYGVLAHLVDADFDEDGVSKFQVFADQQIRFSMDLTYALGNQYKVFISPLGVLFFEKESIGTMFGCQAGIRKNY